MIKEEIVDAIAGASVSQLDTIIKMALDRKQQLSEQVCVPTRISNFGMYLELHDALPQGSDIIAVAVITGTGRRLLPHTRLTHQLYLHSIEEILAEYPDAKQIEVYGLCSKNFVTVWDKSRKS